ncbi:MAG TPA: restriction endonuclease [Chitinophagales bacterium]|nr:restriction endonuclease [Chitinophagales bacterium]
MTEHPLANKKILLSQRRVLMLAGSDLDYPFQPVSPCIHRLILTENAVPTSWQKTNLVGWEIRRISPESKFRILISDNRALITELDDTYSFKCFYSAEGAAVIPIVNYFEKLWQSGTNYPLPKNEPFISAMTNKITKGDLVLHLSKNPSDIQLLTSEEFEKFIAELLRREGMEVQLTGRSRDGGRDILAWSQTSIGRSLCLVECKKYQASRKVDVRMVRALYGILELERATKGMIVTSSDFTGPARKLEASLKNRIVLLNYGEVVKWSRKVTHS